ncbi:MAG: lactonase family protein [Leptothrix sp. (in: b-proteobacteria)]
MNFHRRRIGALATGLALAGLVSVSLPAAAQPDDDDGLLSGMVFSSSNAASGNELLVYARGRDGGLIFHTSVATGGAGSGAGLGSQGAVTLSGDGRWLYVVNAGGNSVSTFAVRKTGLQLVATSDSGGIHPISVTESDGTVFVLNDGGAGNVAGFRNVGGTLKPIAGARRGLSAAGGTAPAQVGFSDEGDAIVVTEKGTNLILGYRVAANGSLGAPTLTPSPGQTPFGFAFSRRNRLVVSEAWGGAAGASTVSSYRFAATSPAQPIAVSAAVPNTQGASCWVAITPNGRYAYVSNTGSQTISSYRITGSGALELIAAVAGTTGTGSSPADSAISAGGHHLFVRNGGTRTISAYAIEPNGDLVAAPVLSGLPPAAVGLAAN